MGGPRKTPPSPNYQDPRQQMLQNTVASSLGHTLKGTDPLDHIRHALVAVMPPDMVEFLDVAAIIPTGKLPVVTVEWRVTMKVKGNPKTITIIQETLLGRNHFPFREIMNKMMVFA